MYKPVPDARPLSVASMDSRDVLDLVNENRSRLKCKVGDEEAAINWEDDVFRQLRQLRSAIRRGLRDARIAGGKVIRSVWRILGAGMRRLQGSVRVLRHDCVGSTDNIGRRVGLLAPQSGQEGLPHQPVMPSARGNDLGERLKAHRPRGRRPVRLTTVVVK
jgi:hypothetical protein